MMKKQTFNVLFLCTANSARSLMAESILRGVGGGKFNSFSAGSMPAGEVHPRALELLRRFNMRREDLRSKSWDEFAGDAAPPMDFVFTVCDRAAAEVCPTWPGQPLSAHWGIKDPAIESDDEIEVMQSFRTAFAELERRINLFISLPFESLDSLRLQREIDDIGRI